MNRKSVNITDKIRDRRVCCQGIVMTFMTLVNIYILTDPYTSSFVLSSSPTSWPFCHPCLLNNKSEISNIYCQLESVWEINLPQTPKNRYFKVSQCACLINGDVLLHEEHYKSPALTSVRKSNVQHHKGQCVHAPICGRKQNVLPGFLDRTVLHFHPLRTIQSNKAPKIVSTTPPSRNLVLKWDQ